MLTPWQFGSDAHRKQQNAALRASSNATPLQFDTVLGPGAVPDSRVQWQRMAVTGAYLPEAEMVARLWTVQRKSDEFKVLTPLRATTGAVVLVIPTSGRPNRYSWAPASASTRPARSGTLADASTVAGCRATRSTPP
jgi:hypothetical protein